MISLLFLISCPFAFAGGQHSFSIKVFTSPDDQFWTNSVIIEDSVSNIRKWLDAH